jgi:hypothetical protein
LTIVFRLVTVQAVQEAEVTISPARRSPRYFDFEGGYSVLDDFDATVSADWLPCDVTLHVVRRPDGQPRCSRLECVSKDDRTTISGELLRSLPLATLLRQILDVVEEQFPVKKVGPGVYDGPLWTDREEMRRYLRQRRRAERARRRRITDEDLRLTADVYRRALTEGSAPVVAVEHALRLSSRSQAARWVMKAREAGFLGAALGPRQSGEQP